MTDFLVIGGGIAGVSAAARLSGLGSVELVEAETALGYHASGRSAATYIESYGNKAVQALNRTSLGELQTAEVLRPRGEMMIGSPGQIALVEAACRDPGTRPITREEALERVPILRVEAIGAAAYTEVAYDLDTDRLIQSFLRRARADGAVVRTAARVTGLARGSRGWTVATTAGDIEARHLVNAAGAWADGVAGLAGLPPLGLTPLRRSIARVPAPGGHDVSGWPLLLGAAEDWYARPDAGKWLISPADAEPCEPHDAWADDMVLAEGIARYEDFVTEPVTRLETSWAGLRTFAPDRALVLGPDPLDPSFIWCAGQGGYGFQTAPAASALVADLVAGRATGLPPEAVAALKVDRLRQAPTVSRPSPSQTG